MPNFISISVLVLVIAVIFYLVHLGRTKERARQLKRNMDAGENDIEIEEEQAKIINSRSGYNLIDRLRNGGF